MTHPRFAFIKARWHDDIVDQAFTGFTEIVDPAHVDAFDVPGAFEIPLLARDLAASGRYAAVIGAAFVVDGGIYRHEFVSATVVDALMRVQLEAGSPVLSLVLTPKSYQETPAHNAFFRDHFVTKGREAADAALALTSLRAAAAAEAA